MMLIFSPITDPDQNDIYTKYHQNPLKTIKVIVWTLNTHEQAPRFIKKSEKYWGEYKYWNSAESWTYISYPYRVSFNIKFEGSSLKNDFRNTKNVYVTWSAIMHIFDEVWCPSSISPKILTKVILMPKNWNPIKSIQVIVRTPSTHERAPRFIKKSVTNSGKYKYWNSANPGLISWVSLNIKFEGSSWKIDFSNVKNAQVTWQAIMCIFNEVRYSYCYCF